MIRDVYDHDNWNCIQTGGCNISSINNNALILMYLIDNKRHVI